MLSAQAFLSIVVALSLLPVILGATAYLILLERKVAAWAQDRIGPNRTDFSFGQSDLLDLYPTLGKVVRSIPGFEFLARKKAFGLGQALADGLKLFVKEDYTPPFVDLRLFLLAPVLAVIPAMIGWAVIPWGGMWAFPGITLGGFELVAASPVDPITGVVEAARVAVLPISVGVVYLLAVGSLAIYGVVLAGFSSNNKFAFLGGLRATAQMLSYEIPMGVCVLIMILMYRTADTEVMVQGQLSAGWFGLGEVWGVLMHPLLAVIFFICVLAECNRAPFDLAEAEQELVGGFHTEYSSMKWALFFLGEYIHMITGSAFIVLMFFGGWSLPFLNVFPAVAEGWLAGIALVSLKMGVFMGKVALVLFVMMWVRWTLPRFRFDQLMRLAWQGMIPLVLVMLLVVGVMVALGLREWWMFTLANVLVIAGAGLAHPFLPTGPKVNRKVPLAGSRFSPA